MSEDLIQATTSEPSSTSRSPWLSDLLACAGFSGCVAAMTFAALCGVFGWPSVAVLTDPQLHKFLLCLWFGPFVLTVALVFFLPLDDRETERESDAGNLNQPMTSESNQ